MDFEQYVFRFNEILQMSDIEIGHKGADDLLRELVFDASHLKFTSIQLHELITMYDRVEKWYA